MSNPGILFGHEDNWETRMGAWFPGERVVFRGKDLFTDVGQQRWMGLYLYGITGRFFTDQQLDLFEGIWTLSVSYPDPRIWNNGVAALAGSTRSTQTLAIAAAIAVSEATLYGHRANIGAIDFLIKTRAAIDTGATLEDLVRSYLDKHRNIPGYGRAVIRSDERIGPLLDLATRLGLATGAHTRLAFEVEQVLVRGRWRRNMNITGLAAALAADQILTPFEYYCYLTPCFIAGMAPCAIESAEKPEGAFMPLRCSRIAYRGKPHRPWNE